MRVGEGRREEESCVFALALALPIFPPQNSTLELLTECVFCLRNLGNGLGWGAPRKTKYCIYISAFFKLYYEKINLYSVRLL